jgi:hypothetical protein
MVVFTYTQMGTVIEDWPHTTSQLPAQGKVMIFWNGRRSVCIAGVGTSRHGRRAEYLKAVP